MTLHSVEPQRATLHGHFSREFPPILVVESGATVRLLTLDVDWDLAPPTSPIALRRKFEPRIPDRDDRPTLCVPVVRATVACSQEAACPAPETSINSTRT